MNPKDVDGLTQLASLYLRKADQARNAAVNAQADTQGVADPTAFQPPATTPLGKAFKSFSAPLSTAISTGSSSKFQTAYSKMTRCLLAGRRRVQGRREGEPERPEHPVRARADGRAGDGDTKTAIAAYKRFLKLAPDDPTAPAIRQRIKQLNQQSQLPTASTG